MVSPYSAGTLTLQEAPSFAWRTNGSEFQPRRASVLCERGNAAARASGPQRVGCKLVLAGLHCNYSEQRSELCIDCIAKVRYILLNQIQRFTIRLDLLLNRLLVWVRD